MLNRFSQFASNGRSNRWIYINCESDRESDAARRARWRVALLFVTYIQLRGLHRANPGTSTVGIWKYNTLTALVGINIHRRLISNANRDQKCGALAFARDFFVPRTRGSRFPRSRFDNYVLCNACVGSPASTTQQGPALSWKVRGARRPGKLTDTRRERAAHSRAVLLQEPVYIYPLISLRYHVKSPARDSR